MPIRKEGQLDIISHSIEQSQRLGFRLGSLLQAGDIVCLSGDMGAGKTVFATGIGKGWGTKIPVTSPTFNLIHDYTRPTDNQHLYHLDCYRLENPADVESIGLDDILSGKGVVIVEWPEVILSKLPPERLWVDIRIQDATRRNYVFVGEGRRYAAVIGKFREFTFGA
ncbi:MAG: tRNA (adenosine(37)-N6)-threonylcarbamoyltransferase complex ATPase subunit type 1 TsaE [Anaerolineae bacterium]